MADDPLLGWGLRSVELADQSRLASYFQSLAEPLSDYTFSQLFTWRNSLRILWKEIEGHLCVFANGTGDLTLLMPPIGDTRSDRALTAAFEIMDAYNVGHGVPHNSRVEYASDELLARFDTARFERLALGTDYVYDTQRMIDLAGGDLASKRQAKNRFMRNYAHHTDAYDPARHLEPCLALLHSWKSHQDNAHPDSTNAVKRQKESLATELTLRHAHELGLRGMVVYVDNVLKAFTFGEALGGSQSSITVEKTDLECKGLAQFIFSEFCRTQWADRPLCNVGDDWGLASLAWTKMSYRPVKLLQKYVLRPVPSTKVSVPSQTAPPPPVMPETLIVAATKADVPAAVELEQACFDSHRISKRQLQYLSTRKSAVFLVARQGERLVGQGIALIRQHKRGLSGRIYSICVRSECRGQKIGQRLLREMIAQLTQRGVKRIYLEVDASNTHARMLYERNGFRSIGKLPDYYGEGKHGLHMMFAVPVPLPVAVS